MIGVSGVAPLSSTAAIYDQEITTDGVTTVYPFSLAAFPDGAILNLAVSFTTSGTKHATYVINVHKQNNIGLTITTLSSRAYDAMAITFVADGYTGVSITLSAATVGVLKIAPIYLNV